jgi:hypothetical protein
MPILPFDPIGVALLRKPVYPAYAEEPHCPLRIPMKASIRISIWLSEKLRASTMSALIMSVGSLTSFEAVISSRPDGAPRRHSCRTGMTRPPSGEQV